MPKLFISFVSTEVSKGENVKPMTDKCWQSEGNYINLSYILHVS